MMLLQSYLLLGVSKVRIVLEPWMLQKIHCIVIGIDILSSLIREWQMPFDN
jgi:hypothetical protein